MTVIVRAARADDLGELATIENEADALLVDRLKPQGWTRAPSGWDRAAQGGFILVAVEDAVVGFAHVLEPDDTAHLEQVSVRPSRGRRGVGRALVEEAVSEALRRGHATMTLRTFAHVPWNAPFYASCGFVESTPTTTFQSGLVEIESALGLPALGLRVQMTRRLRDRRDG